MPDPIIIRDPDGLLQFALLALALPVIVGCVLWWLHQVQERDERR